MSAAATIHPETILHDLAELWVSLAQHPGKGDDASAGVLRACAMTLVAVIEETEDPANVGEAFALLMRDRRRAPPGRQAARHPRLIAGAAALSAGVDLRYRGGRGCPRGGRGARAPPAARRRELGRPAGRAPCRRRRVATGPRLTGASELRPWPPLTAGRRCAKILACDRERRRDA